MRPQSVPATEPSEDEMIDHFIRMRLMSEQVENHEHGHFVVGDRRRLSAAARIGNPRELIHAAQLTVQERILLVRGFRQTSEVLAALKALELQLKSLQAATREIQEKLKKEEGPIETRPTFLSHSRGRGVRNREPYLGVMLLGSFTTPGRESTHVVTFVQDTWHRRLALEGEIRPLKAGQEMGVAIENGAGVLIRITNNPLAREPLCITRHLWIENANPNYRWAMGLNNNDPRLEDLGVEYRVEGATEEDAGIAWLRTKTDHPDVQVYVSQQGPRQGRWLVRT